MSEALKQMQEESFRLGFQEGLQLGRQQVLRKIVKKMLRMNHSISFILELTELSEQEIQKIKEDLND